MQTNPVVGHFHHPPGPPENNVYIGRPSKWGNPFVIGRDGTRSEVIALYEKYLQASPKLMSSLAELAGKNLICWCSPKACHGDILLRYANPEAKAALG
jgi:hypothetical protein